MHCRSCGVEVVEQAVYCHQCGERIGSAEDDIGRDSRLSNDSTASPVDAFKEAVSARRNSRDEPEEELWRGGYSSKAMIGAWVASGLFSLLLLVVGILWAQTGTWWLVLAALMALPWLYNLTVMGYRRMSVRYILTTQRFIHETGILRRVNDRIEVLDMDDIAYEQGLLERLVSVGTIRIVSSDHSHPEFLLRGIEDVKRISEMFDDARRIERRRRGLHVEQI